MSDHLKTIQAYSQALWNDKRLTVIDDFFDPNVRIKSPLKWPQSPATMKGIVEKWLCTFQDMTVSWDEYVCEGNKVVSR